MTVREVRVTLNCRLQTSGAANYVFVLRKIGWICNDCEGCKPELEEFRGRQGDCRVRMSDFARLVHPQRDVAPSNSFDQKIVTRNRQTKLGSNVKLISINHNAHPAIGILEGDQRYILDPARGWPATMQEFAADWDQWKPKILAEIKLAERIPADPSCFLAPITNMEKVICIGVNYADHAREMGGEPAALPVVFNKFPSTINRPGGDIELPSISEQVDFEAELVVVIGKPGRHIPQATALDHVFGYCCGIDVTARDWQKGRPGGQWLLGKTFDTFAPIGPAIVTADEVSNPHELDIQLRLNNQVMQSSNTSQLIFPIDFLISHLSRFATLRTGDLLFTGTPAGVGAGRTPPVFLRPGDRLEVEIAGLGVLKNQVVAACSARFFSGEIDYLKRG